MQLERSTGAGKRLMPAAVALLIVVTASQAWADFKAGVEAYQRGDYATALTEFRLLAQQGDASAQSNLGLMYSKGRGVAQDYAEALRWYRLAAEQGDALAQFNLGVMYFVGRGVPQEDAEAVRWYRRAAERGDAGAQFNLGLTHFEGRGVAQDYVQAHMWVNLAAAQGRKDARKARDKLAELMTPAQLAEAQRLAREWTPKQ